MHRAVGSEEQLRVGLNVPVDDELCMRTLCLAAATGALSLSPSPSISSPSSARKTAKREDALDGTPRLTALPLSLSVCFRWGHPRARWQFVSRCEVLAAAAAMYGHNAWINLPTHANQRQIASQKVELRPPAGRTKPRLNAAPRLFLSRGLDY